MFDLSALKQWTVQDWGAAVSAGSALLGALATLVIAAIVHRWSVRQARQQVTHDINMAFRTYNLSALCEPDMMNAISGAHARTHSPDQLRQLFVVYYRLSTLNDIFEAKRNRMLPNALKLYGFSAWVEGLCRNYRTSLEEALEDQRGFSLEFVAHVRKCVAEYDKKLASPATKPLVGA